MPEKNGFGEILPVQGQPRLSSKGNLAYPRPIFPKNNTEAKYTIVKLPRILSEDVAERILQNIGNVEGNRKI